MFLFKQDGTLAGTLYDGIFNGAPGWMTTGATAATAGNYYLTTQVGSYDETFGGAIGANLHIDNVRLSSETSLVADIVDVSKAPVAGSINSVTVKFNKAINASTFTTADLKLTRGENISTNLIDSNVTISQVDAQTYTVNGLKTLTSATGIYRLFLNQNTITDLNGNPGLGGLAFDSWEVIPDTTKPTVTNVTSPSVDKTYMAGEKVDVAVTFSESVLVSGTPELALKFVQSEASLKYLNGVNSEGSAKYTGGSGTNTLTFSYTVQAQNSSLDLDYASTGALTLAAGATITDVAGNQAVLTLAAPNTQGSLGLNKNIQIKGFADIKGGAARDNYFNFNLFSKLEKLSSDISAQKNPVEVGGINLADVFDETHYLSQNPDVANAINSGAFETGYEHFSSLGWKEGRNPSVLFDEKYYLSNNADIAKAVADKALGSGLEHFLLHGHKEGRDPSALFRQQDYLTQNSDIKDAVAKGFVASGFEHYVEYGAFEARSHALSLYNEAYYLRQNSDVAAAVVQGAVNSGFEHFISFGQREGRVASSLFNESSYLANNADIKGAISSGAFASGFEHYIEYGRAEGRVA
ncbi:hypothetical protein [Pseudanabaena sp. FACHB-2040]|uniref:hypothetical protein n=1 Tax=Pseudanabaena sp. FACHB-2040 TaxID=2692859 RepID=UPI001686CEA8|nr:hypothetical protein [Pseudanabaena sp. FACHB-2040]MBD2261063.1 hypothetical protein [Pseudanabaena sp. FACHB-2040]